MKVIIGLHFVFATLLMVLLCAFDKYPTNEPKVDRLIQQAMDVHGIPGVALAIIKDGHVIHQKSYGLASIEHHVATGDHHLFRVYSMTKLLVATAIFQLIERDKLSLKDPIKKYIGGLPIHWQEVQVEHILNHASGIPDFVKYDDSLTDDELMEELKNAPMDFEKGARFWYNQTNYWLLGQIIEKVSGLSLNQFIANNQFEGINEGLAFSSDPFDVIPNRTSKYDYDSNLDRYVQSRHSAGKRGYAANGLAITLYKLLKWNQQLDDNELMSKETKNSMWSKYHYKNEQDNFLHGWGMYDRDGKMSIGFTGGGVSAFRKYLNQDLTIILLTNGYKHTPVHNDLVYMIADIVESEINHSSTRVNYELLSSFVSKDFSSAYKEFQLAEESNPSMNFEQLLNRVGYILIRQDRITESIEIFKLNTIRYPQSANTFDSLGEAYLENDQLDLAKECYQKVLEVDPDFDNAKQMLETIKELRKVK